MLEQMQNQLPVFEAVGGAQKMVAQYGADYATAMDQGKTATEAVALATANLAAAQLQVSSAAKEQLQSLRDQYGVASAVSGVDQIRAQAQATYNQLLRQGVDQSTALATAGQVEANSRGQATAAVRRQVEALKDQIAMVRASENGTEAEVAAAIAYKNAINSGADASAAAALKMQTLALYAQQAFKAAEGFRNALYAGSSVQFGGLSSIAASTAASSGTGAPDGFSNPGHLSEINFEPVEFKGFSSTGELGTNRNYNDLLRYQAQNAALGVQGDVNSAYGSGDIVAAMNAIKGASNTSGADPTLAALAKNKGYDLNAIFGQQASAIDDKISQMDSLTQLQNAKTNDKGTQVSNLQGEMDWLQTLPETISRDQKIVSLQQSIDSLKNATDANTAATSATLNPLYSQGHGALAIGYYKAASGLDMVAHGPTVGDQVPFHAMVNGGERITITPPGKSGNDNSSRQTTNNNNFIFNDTRTSNARRSQRQFAQGFGQTAAAGR